MQGFGAALGRLLVLDNAKSRLRIGLWIVSGQLLGKGKVQSRFEQSSAKVQEQVVVVNSNKGSGRERFFPNRFWKVFGRGRSQIKLLERSREFKVLHGYGHI